jgi:hypothetical protein
LERFERRFELLKAIACWMGRRKQIDRPKAASLSSMRLRSGEAQRGFLAIRHVMKPSRSAD